MDSDQEMNGSGAETTKPTFTSSAKGKGKAVDRGGQDASQDDTLPWSASPTHLLILGLLRSRTLCGVLQGGEVSTELVG